MYFRDWVSTAGFSWLLIGLIAKNIPEGTSTREVNKKYSMLTRDERFSYGSGGYNNNNRYNSGYDYNRGTSENIRSSDTNYDNYGNSQSSRNNNYDSFGNAKKTDTYRYIGNSDSNLNRHQDFDSSMPSDRYGNHNNYFGWNSYEKK